MKEAFNGLNRFVPSFSPQLSSAVYYKEGPRCRCRAFGHIQGHLFIHQGTDISPWWLFPKMPPPAMDERMVFSIWLKTSLRIPHKPA
jgi:hypothetical protein